MKLTLHDYRRCPFCIRVRILLELKSIPYEHVHEPLREWTDWMLTNVKKPRVPVLHVVNNDGTEQVMPESNDINLWLDSNFAERSYTPEEDTKEYNEMLEWWEWCVNKFKPMIDLYKYGENRVFDQDKHKIHTEKLFVMLSKLEMSLGNKGCLLSDELTLADIAIIPFVRQIMRTRNGEFDLSLYPKVRRWSSKILDTDWFNDIVMAKKY